MINQALEIVSQIQDDRVGQLPVICKLLNLLSKQYPHYIELIFLEKTKASLVFIAYNAKLRQYVLLQIFQSKYRINEEVRNQEIELLKKSNYSQFIGKLIKQISLIEHYVILEDTKKQKIIYSNLDQEGVQQRDVFLIYEFDLDSEIFQSENHSKQIFEFKKKKVFNLSEIQDQHQNVRILKIATHQILVGNGTNYFAEYQDGLLYSLQSKFQIGQEIALCSNLFSLTIQLKKNLLKIEAFQDISQGISQCSNLFIFNFDLQETEEQKETDLNEEGIIILFKGITKCEKLASLMANLSYCNISQEGAITIGKEISKCINLTTLEINFLGNKQIGQAGSSQFVQNIQKCSNIDTILLNFGDCEAGSKAVSGIGQKISKCTKITKLNLDFRNCKVDQANLQVFTTSLKNLTSIDNLTINLSNCKIGNGGLSYLGQSISTFANLNSLNLDLSTNVFKLDGLTEFVIYITQCKEIHELKLNLKKSEVSFKGISDVIEAFSKLSYLTILSLSLAENILASSIITLGTALAKCQNLTSLEINLSQTSLSKNFLENFVSSLRKLGQLQYLNLNLSNNKLSECEADVLGTYLSQINNLNTLLINLEKSSFQNNQFTLLFEELKKSKSLHYLKITLNQSQGNEKFIKESKIQFKKHPYLLKYYLL